MQNEPLAKNPIAITASSIDNLIHFTPSVKVCMKSDLINYHTKEFIAVFIALRDQSLFKFEGGEGGGENVGPSISSSTTWEGLKSQKED